MWKCTGQVARKNENREKNMMIFLLDMTVSPLKVNPSNSSLYTMNVTWTPTSIQLGVNLVCYTPVRLVYTIICSSFDFFLSYSWIVLIDKEIKCALNILSMILTLNLLVRNISMVIITFFTIIKYFWSPM